MKTNIPPTVLNQILQTRLSAETTVSLLNEKENFYSLKPRHLNAKRVYPFWKVCNVCQTPYMAHTKEQATRSKTCSKKCMGEIIRKVTKARYTTKEKPQPMKECPVCKKMFYPEGQSKNKPRVVCSRQCNGALRGEAWKAHAHKGRASWKEESEQALKERMTGSTNPSWKGGLTYRNRKGQYATQKIKYVRCPIEYIAMARKDGYVMEHRLIVAVQMQRPLTRTEAVHHINHDATDNRLENLMLFRTNAEHKQYEHGKPIIPLWQP
jgi:hypothetical protein